MVNRLADRIMNAVLPHRNAAAPCGPWVISGCYCSGGLHYGKKCRDCTGAGGGCSGCTIVIGSC